MGVPIRKPVRNSDGVWCIPLTQGLFAKVSPEDVERVAQFNWCASRESRGRKIYAIRWINRRINGKRVQTKIRMHRFILDLPPSSVDGLVVDHISHEGLDNRRENLEVVTQEENMARSEGWKKKVEEPCL